MAKGKELVGRAKGNIKNAAIEQAGKGATPEKITDKANAMAKEQGYEPTFTVEWIADNMEAKAPKGKKASGGIDANTIVKALAIAKDVGELAESAGGKAKLLALLEAVDKAGGNDTVREILEAM